MNTYKYAHIIKIAKTDLKDLEALAKISLLTGGLGIGTAGIINAIRNLSSNKNLSRKDKIRNFGRDALIGGLLGAGLPLGVTAFDALLSPIVSNSSNPFMSNSNNPFNVSNSNSPFKM
jgi:hypothetical protein